MIDDPINPKQIYKQLIERCKNIKVWQIECILDEGWVGISPFPMSIQDGVFILQVMAPTKRDAFLEVVNTLPVIKFLTEQDD